MKRVYNAPLCEVLKVKTESFLAASVPGIMEGNADGSTVLGKQHGSFIDDEDADW